MLMSSNAKVNAPGDDDGNIVSPQQPSRLFLKHGDEPIFILAGQSNMAGRCNMQDLPSEFIDQHLHIHGGVHFQMCWDNDCNFERAGTSNGQFRDLQCQPSPGLNMTTFGPELAIAAALGPRLFKIGVRRAFFVKFAMGSTNLYSNWNPNNNNRDEPSRPSEIGYYTRFIHFCKGAIEQISNNPNSSAGATRNKRLVGMFWLQGESDSSKAKFARSYLPNFQSLVGAIRADLTCPDLSIVASPVVWSRKHVKVVNAALKEAEVELENYVCIDELDDKVFGVQGNEAGPCAGHLTAEGVVNVGRRMGEEFPL